MSSNVYVKAQNKRKATSVAVYCRFCGSKWRKPTKSLAHFEPQKRQYNTIL